MAKTKKTKKSPKSIQLDGKSFLPQDEFTQFLKSKFPTVFTEGKIDLKKLKQTLGETVNVDSERYGLSWAGKNDCFRHIQEPTTATLKPNRKESVDFDKTENIFIEGENLQVLKVLQKSYYGKIKMIYIDPPYNTGSDSFIYPDRFQESQEEYLKRIGEKDAEGNLMKDGMFQKNSRDNGHFHSNWLSMMYPRLFLARNLLKEDGLISVSIDDNEVNNLRNIMDEVFGEENFFAQLIIQSNKRGQTYKQISKTHEYVLIYTKSVEAVLNELEKNAETNDLNFSDDIGAFNIRELRNRNPKFGRFNRPNLFFPIYVNPTVTDKDGLSPISLKKDKDYSVEITPLNSQGGESCWRWSSKLVAQNINTNTQKSNLIAKSKKDGNFNIYEKYRKTTYKPKSIWDETEVITEQGTVELGRLNLSKYFDFPKPSYLIKKLIQIGSAEDSIILDFFSGSGTTAHATMNLNAEDGGERKFILVQLPEPCPKGSEAFKAGFENIAKIGIERIRRAGKEVSGSAVGQLDSGVKVFKLEESNFKTWRSDYKTGKELQKQLEMFVDNVQKDSTQENILYELILKSGLDLNVGIECKEHKKYKYFLADEERLIVFLGDKISSDLVDHVLSIKPQKFICLDRAFAKNDQLKTNTFLQMESAKIDFKVI